MFLVLTDATTNNPITMHDYNCYSINLAPFSNSDILLPLLEKAATNN